LSIDRLPPLPGVERIDGDFKLTKYPRAVEVARGGVMG